MLELRRLEAPGISAKRQEPYPGYEQAVRQLLSAADAVIVSGPVEEAFLRSLGCSAPAVQGRPYVAIGDADPHAPRVIGTGPFVLIHAPVEPRNNQYLMLRAAALAGLPVVVAGPAADAGYYEALRRSSGERVVFVPDVSPRLAQALYRSARVYADLSWISYGTSRVAAAGAAGCALVVGRGSQGATLSGETAWVADPASVDSMAVALGDAWMHAAEPAGRIASGSARIAAWAEPGSALRATVQAYAAAQQSRVHA
jgi:glycosyltransferase involved in cell wall biosynthesis